jgi:DNA mismatch endonuclease (patch repair protein)
MQSNRSRDTKPELAVRHELFRRGFRYRVALAPLKGVRRTVDIAFPRQHIAVLIDGCFWHGCPEHHRSPHAHSDYWSEKVRRNAERDAETTAMLQDAGWTVLRFWEHETPTDVADAISATVLSTRVSTQHPVTHPSSPTALA